MIFDTGGSRKIAVTGLESWKVGEFFSRKERKVRKGCKLETRNSKLETDQSTGKTFDSSRQKSASEKGTGES